MTIRNLERNERAGGIREGPLYTFAFGLALPYTTLDLMRDKRERERGTHCLLGVDGYNLL